MIPRTRFDLGWRDLLFGYRQIFTSGDRLALQREVERYWSPDDEWLACLSLRSGFDVTLAAYDFPPGSEVLMSCMNIGPMAEIVEDNGLTPVPIDLDMDTLSMRRDLLEKAITPKTVAIVHAHVLGARQQLDELRELCDKHGLILFEDCAQCYRADEWRGDPRSDVTMFSFGPLKTCSATMGGIVRYRDQEIHRKARAIQSQLPVQRRSEFYVRMVLFSELLFITQNLPYTIAINTARRLGLEEFVNTPVRNFNGPRDYQGRKLRKQPSYPLLAMMLHRWKTFDPVKVQQRLDAADAVLSTIPNLSRPGRAAEDHGYWLFPICTDDPVALRRELHRKGFDSTLGHKTFVVLEPPAGYQAFEAAAAKATKEKALYLPIHFRAPKKELVRLAEVIRDFDPKCAGVHESDEAMDRQAQRTNSEQHALVS
ncbi:DegT/DnrJ/EryC1/StrS family aminotransferase [Botrimarina mediterranea]|uniref:UDP-4-amino-4-deoxy-L-arabinose--oxoglutarate aminotransferase n=1 Tax=Botrimarina mediterranea TaxID=2528022 RepID=A0A518KA06_9BACT|nr:DegT/DnrJ/EryC1/StrS family aminotransferase [Botrimarina mediterranea]QDV74625.1 UDP-4-amino-4-deoxy-L-arabinose--oxoglutarate aminotransferase [Botrimarina mediterranea]